MKYRDSDISKALLPLIDAGKDYIITAEAPDFADVKDKDVVKGLLTAPQLRRRCDAGEFSYSWGV
jgi:hypothetical protein